MRFHVKRKENKKFRKKKPSSIKNRFVNEEDD